VAGCKDGARLVELCQLGDSTIKTWVKAPAPCSRRCCSAACVGFHRWGHCLRWSVGRLRVCMERGGVCRQATSVQFQPLHACAPTPHHTPHAQRGQGHLQQEEVWEGRGLPHLPVLEPV